jgi:bifunctional enzyme CysN/CysC
MDERPLDPGRVYLVKHNTRMATAEVDRPLALNEIGTLTVTASQPFVFDPYVENRTTGSFVLIDPATNFTAGAGMILRPLRDETGVGVGSAAERLALTARAAATDAEAIEAVRRLLEEVLV